MVSNTQLYGATIAVVSGVYSLWSATGASRMVTSSWIMMGIGTLVIFHGLVLVTPFVDRLGSASGPLMVGYAVVMVFNQILLATGMLDDGSTGMGGGMGTSGMAWDVGMVALATLMLVSGLIMVRDPNGDAMGVRMERTTDR